MKDLTDKQREYLEDCLNGMTLREIAAKHGVRFSTVSRTVHRALDGSTSGGAPITERKRSELTARLATRGDL